MAAAIIEEIREELFDLQDAKYGEFQAKLIPTVDPKAIIGVRTPDLRKLAKKLVKREEIGAFLEAVPHQYFDENQLHAFIVSEMKDFAACLAEVDRFLPYVDNWATCDQMSPKVFKKHRAELLAPIGRWIAGGEERELSAGETYEVGGAETYTVRFAVGMLMEHFLDADFDPAYPEMVAAVRSEEYYVRMMVAWYFATALAKQYDAVLPYIEEERLDVWTHNKTIQKAVESYRISPEQKVYLKGLKITRK